MSAPRADQQFCLRWNSFHSNMTSSFHNLRSDEDFVDVTLAAEGQLIKAHRVILSACSPFFKQILKSAPCHHPVVVLHEVRAAHVRGLLSFMYQGQVNLTPDQMPEFLRAAQALHVKGLFEDLQTVSSDGKENAPQPQAAPPPPPPLLDTRLATKRSETAADQPVAPAAKRARGPSPPAAEPAVKREPASPAECPPTEERTADSGAEASPPPPPVPAPVPVLTPACAHSRRVDPAFSVSSAESLERNSRSMATSQPTTSQESSRSLTTSQSLTSQDRGRSLATSQPMTSHASSSASSDPDYVVTHTAYPFPCPFCEKSYTSWGFRRRHIKAFHTAGPTLKCKWCWQVLPSHDEWCSHVTGEHHLSTGDAQHAIQILDEANLVLQSSEPLRLESLVDMVKRQQRRTSASPEAALQGTASS